MRIRTLHGPLGPLGSVQDGLGSHPSAAPARGLKERKLGSWAGSPPLPQTLEAPAGRSLGGAGTWGWLGASPALAGTAPAWPLGSMTGHRSSQILKLGDNADFFPRGHLFLNGLDWSPGEARPLPSSL